MTEQLKIAAQAAYLGETMPTHECKPSDFYIDGYLRARNEQAAEIAELMPLAKFGASVLKAYKEGYVSDEEIGNFALRSGCLTQPIEGYAPDIEATTTKLLKD